MSQLFQAEYLRHETVFDQPIARQIWQQKYQYKTHNGAVDRSVNDTWRRVAEGLVAHEKPEDQQKYAAQFYFAMEGFKLLPGGRILAGCGTARRVTLFNTFVMANIPDSLDGILNVVKEAAVTMQMGGGIGFDFSTVRPRGSLVRSLDCPAAGPLAAMDICDAVCKMLVSGMGRGAMMATMRCDHPDIESFIAAKSDPSRFRNFNLSVMVTDEFMRAAAEDKAWNLVWNGSTHRTLSARALWKKILRQTYETAEPGVLFIDRINQMNPLSYLETVSATNSCAEQPLPPNGACPLASLNLARLVSDPFSANASLDLDEVRRLAGVGVRMLDNVVDISQTANREQAREASMKRRIGIGVTGVADALIMCGVRYGTQDAADLLEQWMQTIQNAAYQASAELACERGTFPMYDKHLHMGQEGIRRLSPQVREAIEKFGLRNGVITSIAPTGTISMFAGNVSSGIEPVFATSYRRKITSPLGSERVEIVEDFAALQHRQLFGVETPLPDEFVTATDLMPSDHIRMQAVAQKWVDSGISKTVNCPEDIPFDDFQSVYLDAYASNCKGCTTYRPNGVTGSVLSQ